MSAAINRLLLRAWCACPSFWLALWRGHKMKTPDTTNAVPSAPNSANFTGPVPLAATPARSHTRRQRMGHCRPVRCSGTVCAGAIHTTKQAANLPDSEVFSRSEFMVSGLGVPIRKDGSTTCFVC